jgi:hypothetical protein
MMHEAPNNTDCAAARQRCHDCVDGLADWSTLEGHLAGCDDCRRYVGQMRALSDGLDRLRLETSEVVWPSPARVAQVAAAVVILVGAAWYVISRRPPGDRIVGGRPAGPQVALTQPCTRVDTAVVRSTASIVLTGTSAESYVVLPRETGRAGVHLFVLYPMSQAAVSGRGP